jgi:Copper/zinc superoxide dismutase (SODC).
MALSSPGRRLTTLLAGALAMAAFAPAVLADGATVARGDVHAFATAAGQPITGRAQMVRTADGKTIVSIHVEGLLPGTAYGSHIHKQACADGDAGTHYKFDPAGVAAPPNEIWLGFTTNSAGVGNSDTIVLAKAGPTAVSVVVHAPGGAKIACADLS